MVQACFRLVAGFSAAGCFAGAFLAGAFRAVVLVAGALPSGFSSDFLSAAIKSTTFDPLGRAGSSSGVTLPPLAFSRSEEHTSALQSLMRISYAVFCLKKKKNNTIKPTLSIITT